MWARIRSPSAPIQKGVEIISSIYDVPAVCFRARAAMTNTPPTRPYRSSGRPEVMYVMERLIDIAARRSGLDRIALRKRNFDSRIGDAVPQIRSAWSTTAAPITPR